MSVMSGFASKFGDWSAPMVRAYVRYSLINFGKAKLLDLFRWRARRYTVATKHSGRMSGMSNDLVPGYIYYFGVWEPTLTALILQRMGGLRDRTFVDTAFPSLPPNDWAPTLSCRHS